MNLCRRKPHILRIVLVVSIASTLVLGVLSLAAWERDRVSGTRLYLFYAQKQIAGFREGRGRYPYSLSELRQYAEDNPNAGFTAMIFEEEISSVGGNSLEYEVLNGKGGWFYNKVTGEVRINLTMKVKKYLWFYFGDYKDEIPAEWGGEIQQGYLTIN